MKAKLWFVLGPVLFVVLGYVSSSLTASACERSTQQWLRETLAGYPDNGWPGRGASSGPAKLSYPWVVTTEYGYAVGPTGGEWGTRRYVCVFGLAIPAGKKVR